MTDLGSTRFNLGIAWLMAGIAAATVSRSMDGVIQGALAGAGVAMILTGVYVVGRSMRDGTSWLPSRDGNAPSDGADS